MRTAITLGAIFLGSFLLFAALFLRFPVLYDGDSYFHLAAARLYAHGVPDGLPWARFSVMHEGWGDKELLFHVLLLPFSLLPDPAVGGRLALALLNATLLTLLSGLGRRAVGTWGLLAGPMVYLLQPDFLNRAFRLRPELLAVILMLILISVAARRRWVAVTIVSFVFALSYTAVHVAVGLALLWALWDRYESGSWNVKLPFSVTGGVALGLLAHPQFPKNLEIWWIQNVRFFEMKGRLDVGEEIFAPELGRLLLSNAPLALALVAIWLASREPREDSERDSSAPYLVISAAAFLVLYVSMARMVTWAAPLVTLAALFVIGRKHVTGERVVIGKRGVSLALVLVAALLIALPRTVDPAMVASLRSADRIGNEDELARFGEAVPDGARIAATWRDAELYAFYAPQGEYLNVLDPIFMALPFPEEFEAQRAVFDGTEPDIPRALISTLKSGMIAFDRAEVSPLLLARVSGDPRFQLLHAEQNVLAAVRPDKSFILDWVDVDGHSWPRSENEKTRVVEGFVDVRGIAAVEGCVTVAHEMLLDDPAVLTLNFAPWGTGHLEIDGQKTGLVNTPALAVLGSGARVRADLGSGAHRIAVTTCAHEARVGFYLRRE